MGPRARKLMDAVRDRERFLFPFPAGCRGAGNGKPETRGLRGEGVAVGGSDHAACGDHGIEGGAEGFAADAADSAQLQNGERSGRGDQCLFDALRR